MKTKENYSDEELLKLLKNQMIRRKLSKVKPIFISWIVSIIVLILILAFTSVTNQYISYLIYVLTMYMIIIPIGMVIYLIVKFVKR